MSTLHFFQLTDADGVPTVKLGTVARDKATGEFKDLTELGGKGLGVYVVGDATGGVHGLAQIGRLATKGPLMVRDVVAKYARSTRATPPAEERPDPRRKRITVKTSPHSVNIHSWISLGEDEHRIQPSVGSRNEVIESWLDGAERNQMLVEIDADADAIETLNRYLATEIATSPAISETPKPPQRAGSAQASAEQLTAAARRRADLAEIWFTATEVAGVCGSKAENARQMASRLRRNGEILGVWMAPENRYKYPDYQFTADGIVPEMKRLLALLPKGNGSGWAQAQWLNTPHALLDGQRPSEVLSTDPARVLDIARKQFSEPRDAGW